QRSWGNGCAPGAGAAHSICCGHVKHLVNDSSRPPPQITFAINVFKYRNHLSANVTTREELGILGSDKWALSELRTVGLLGGKKRAPRGRQRYSRPPRTPENTMDTLTAVPTVGCALGVEEHRNENPR